jgi:hypothetical protein
MRVCWACLFLLGAHMCLVSTMLVFLTHLWVSVLEEFIDATVFVGCAHVCA